jgi:hypothetical protein
MGYCKHLPLLVIVAAAAITLLPGLWSASELGDEPTITAGYAPWHSPSSSPPEPLTNKAGQNDVEVLVLNWWEYTATPKGRKLRR